MGAQSVRVQSDLGLLQGVLSSRHSCGVNTPLPQLQVPLHLLLLQRLLDLIPVPASLFCCSASYDVSSRQLLSTRYSLPQLLVWSSSFVAVSVLEDRGIRKRGSGVRQKGRVLGFRVYGVRKDRLGVENKARSAFGISYIFPYWAEEDPIF